MWVAIPNTTYFAMIVQESDPLNPLVWTKRIYLNGNLSDERTHVEQQYNHPWLSALWAVVNDTVRASDNLPINITEWHYFTWHIWEHISWNHSLDQAEVNWKQEYFSNKWWVVLFYEKNPIPTPTSMKNPTYQFITNSTGSLTYGWSCNSTTITAIDWENTIIFDSDWAGSPLVDWIYNDCTITLIDWLWFNHVLNVTPFEVISSSIFLTEITPIPTPTNNHFPQYTFDSPISWTISYFWWCTSNDTSAVIWNNTVTMNYLTAWTYNTCYISVSNWIDTSETLNITEFVILDDGPILDSKSIIDNRLYPIWNFNFNFTYHDTGWTWIDLASEKIELYKWNWTAWWADISWTYLTNTLLTTTWSNYTANSIPFWKYKNVFKISSNEWVELNEETIFYVDDIEFVVSTWSINMWNLNIWTETFSPEINITVKTVWAWFNVIMNKTQLMTNHNSDEIRDYDWVKWVWYDQEIYSGDVTAISTNTIIANQAAILNTDWNKNTYTIRFKTATLITEEQAAWSYDSKLKFWIQLSY